MHFLVSLTNLPVVLCICFYAILHSPIYISFAYLFSQCEPCFCGTTFSLLFVRNVNRTRWNIVHCFDWFRPHKARKTMFFPFDVLLRCHIWVCIAIASHNGVAISKSSVSTFIVKMGQRFNVQCKASTIQCQYNLTTDTSLFIDSSAVIMAFWLLKIHKGVREKVRLIPKSDAFKS